MATAYQLLPIDALQRGRYQPRLHFNDASLQELADSILTQGLIEPLIVREIITGRYEIIAGERRWRAAKIVKLTEVPCIVGTYTDKQAAALTLVENIQREELNLIEEACGYRRLRDEFNFHQDEIASLVSKSRSHIANILRLLNLCSQVQEQIINGKLALGHARLLVGMAPTVQIELTAQIINNDWSVRTLEEKVKQLKKTAREEPEKTDLNIKHLEVQLAEQVGAPVQIVAQGRGGWLQIKFFDNDTLAGLLERMGLRYD
ncbi:chromosome partitioning protein ParB [Legionella beliardensis]|uniref:Probable chromosome-partitioning protein ParB n=1 Tax=Legionella beliardensis TaxID=91822 RepID=A0A378I5P5_9GAMM|nr:ParB/RepB/Spo0J family partition protein [Legionella beliardensis]STX29981.1 chromosome partitioning protein ParB [Legionella beliardensis]